MAYHISLKNAEPTGIPIHHTFFRQSKGQRISKVSYDPNFYHDIML